MNIQEITKITFLLVQFLTQYVVSNKQNMMRCFAMKMNDKRLKAVSLEEENSQYKGTGGVSEGNRAYGFIPAFLDTVTGYAYPSRFANGKLAPVHLFDGLPEKLVEKSVVTGKVYALRKGLVSGFLRGQKFYTRSEAATATAFHE